MAKAKSWAQDIIPCDLCDKPTQQFCNSCQVSLCDDCVGKHRDEFQSLSHEIVSFINRKIQLAFPECQEHSGQRCQVYCKQCLTPVCIMCFMGLHANHPAVELVKIVERKKSGVKKETEEIEETLIPLYKKKESEVRSLIAKVTTDFEKVENLIETNRKTWHHEVDNIFCKLSSLNRDIRERNTTVLEDHKSKIKKLISSMKNAVKKHKEILSSNKASEINKHQSKMKDYRQPPEEVEVKTPSIVIDPERESCLSIEMDGFKAIMTQQIVSPLKTYESQQAIITGGLLEKAKVLATVHTEYNPLWSLACLGSEEAWVSGNNNTITRVDINGTVRETFITTYILRPCLFLPNDISVNRQGNLIYSDNQTVNIVKHGKSQKLIIPPDGWYPYRLCCAESGDIIVHMKKEEGSNKVLRYREQKITQEIYKDDRRNLIFMKGFGSVFLTENNNGDICASDGNANVVLVVDNSNSVRFRYDGKSARFREPFQPGCIVTDSLSQIIVTDFKNDCLYILSKSGHLLRCLANCELDKPYGLSMDNEGRLWVGLCDSGKIKIIEYLGEKA